MTEADKNAIRWQVVRGFYEAIGYGILGAFLLSLILGCGPASDPEGCCPECYRRGDIIAKEDLPIDWRDNLLKFATPTFCTRGSTTWGPQFPEKKPEPTKPYCTLGDMANNTRDCIVYTEGLAAGLKEGERACSNKALVKELHCLGAKSPRMSVVIGTACVLSADNCVDQVETYWRCAEDDELATSEYNK